LKFGIPGLRCRASWAAEGGELGSNSEKNGCDFRDEDTGGQIKNKELFDIRGMRAPEGDCSRTRRRREGRKVRCDVKYISVRHHLGWRR
jgi:hypothetical protein